MNKHLKQLVELAKMDKEIDDFGPKIGTIELELKAVAQKEQNIASRVMSCEEEIKECKLKKAKNELHLAELADKLTELSKKGAIVKTDKEIKALQLEEEISKEQCEFANEEIDRLDKLIEAKEIDKKEFKVELKEREKEGKEVRKSIESQMKEIEEHRSKVYEVKEKLIAKMSQKILTFYEKIRKWALNTTVVPVKKQACYGCFMRLNDKIYAEVIKQDDIVTCPHCGRILYKETEETEA